MAEIEPNTFTPTQNASGIWQNLWSALFLQFNKEMTIGNFLGAWKTLQLLKAQIPPECEEDIQTEYDKAKTIIKKPITAYSTLEASRIKKMQISDEAPEALLSLISKIRKSLYDKKWISREMGFSGIDPNKATKDL